MSKLTHESLRQMISEEISKLEASKSEPKSVKVTAKQLRGIILQEVRSMNEAVDANSSPEEKALKIKDIVLALADKDIKPGEVTAIISTIAGLEWLTNIQLVGVTKSQYRNDHDRHLASLISSLVAGKSEQSLAVKALLTNTQIADLIAATAKYITLDV